MAACHVLHVPLLYKAYGTLLLAPPWPRVSQLTSGIPPTTRSKGQTLHKSTAAAPGGGPTGCIGGKGGQPPGSFHFTHGRGRSKQDNIDGKVQFGGGERRGGGDSGLGWMRGPLKSRCPPGPSTGRHSTALRVSRRLWNLPLPPPLMIRQLLVSTTPPLMIRQLLVAFKSLAGRTCTKHMKYFVNNTIL